MKQNSEGSTSSLSAAPAKASVFNSRRSGMRECVAFFRYVARSDDNQPPADYSQDLGLMLYDVFDLRETNDRER